MEIIDTHVHLWDLARFRLPWVEGAGPVLERSWSYQDFLDAQNPQSGYSIKKAVYIEVDLAHDQRELENSFVVDLVADQGNVFTGGCISGDLTSTGFAEYLLPWASRPEIKGVRQALHVPSAVPGTCLTETFLSNVRLLGEHGLVFEGCVRNPELGDLATLASECPDTTIIVDHMGIVDADVAGSANPDADERAYLQAWRRNMTALGRLSNTVCKVSGLNPSQPWTVETLGRAVGVALESFDSDRVIFASNFPVLNVALTFDDWTRSMLTFTEEMNPIDREAFFSGNAERVYKI